MTIIVSEYNSDCVLSLLETLFPWEEESEVSEWFSSSERWDILFPCGFSSSCPTSTVAQPHWPPALSQTRRQAPSLGSLHGQSPCMETSSPAYPHGSSPLGPSLDVICSVTPILSTLVITTVLHCDSPILFFCFFPLHDLFSNMLFYLLTGFYFMSPKKRNGSHMRVGILSVLFTDIFSVSGTVPRVFPPVEEESRKIA